jgi:hypothetical protein
MVARNTNVPFKGRIQKRKTYHLQIITFRLQRAAGPYRSAKTGLMHRNKRRTRLRGLYYSTISSAWTKTGAGTVSPRSRATLRFTTNSNFSG